jgi:hypothetical protein
MPELADFLKNKRRVAGEGFVMPLSSLSKDGRRADASTSLAQQKPTPQRIEETLF